MESTVFEFSTTDRIVFGPGTLSQAAPAATEMGEKALLVTGSPERAVKLTEQLRAHRVEHVAFRVSREPDIETVSKALELARSQYCDLVIAFGGGSVLDTGKTVAALLANGGEVLDYLEHVGRGKPLSRRSAPLIAIPTTAGTGSEVTRNAVIYSPADQVKVSLRSHKIVPHLALVDPELTYSMPPEQTASSGMDTLTQLLEPYVTKKTNPLVDAVCRIGMERAARSIRRAYTNGGNREARRDMALASLMSGMALANARLGGVHGLAGALGGALEGAPHGMLCARLLPLVMKANIEALQARDPDSPVLTRYDEVAVMLTGSRVATGIDGVYWVRALCRDLQIKPLAELGLTKELIPPIIQRSRGSSSMQGNPIPLTDDELSALLQAAM